jgi:nucleoid DNA-binding protein
MLSKSQLAGAVQAELDGFTKQEVGAVLDALAVVASQEIALGEDFKIAGVGKIVYRYTKPRKKGETYTGFGGQPMQADQNRPAKIRMAATVDGKLKKLSPALSSKAGKAIAERKG